MLFLTSPRRSRERFNRNSRFSALIKVRTINLTLSSLKSWLRVRWKFNRLDQKPHNKLTFLTGIITTASRPAAKKVMLTTLVSVKYPKSLGKRCSKKLSTARSDDHFPRNHEETHKNFRHKSPMKILTTATESQSRVMLKYHRRNTSRPNQSVMTAKTMMMSLMQVYMKRSRWEVSIA